MEIAGVTSTDSLNLYIIISSKGSKSRGHHEVKHSNTAKNGWGNREMGPLVESIGVLGEALLKFLFIPPGSSKSWFPQ